MITKEEEREEEEEKDEGTEDTQSWWRAQREKVWVTKQTHNVYIFNVLNDPGIITKHPQRLHI